MKAQAALIGADSAVELDAVAAVDVHLAAVVSPRDAEHRCPLGLDKPLKQRPVLIALVGLDDRSDRIKHLRSGLDKLGLS